MTCLLRFDFATLTVAAPDSTTSGKIGQCTTDYFQVESRVTCHRSCVVEHVSCHVSLSICSVQGINAKTGTTQASGRLTPKICGVNDGMHM